MINPVAQQIFEVLSKINRSPDFSVYHRSKAFFPQLIIDGVGELALPMCEAQAKQLIKQCSKAPYGKGAETIVDETVRNVWELDASKVKTDNQDWQLFINKTLRHCEEQLDLQGQTLIAHPYKLLVYEKGSFFLPHQDTEKEDGMVATLVVSLPSEHRGGELIITHQNKSITVDFSEKKNRHFFQSALFYADCHHEVAPIKEGYRIVLCYNVCLKGKRQLATSNFCEQEKDLAKLFKNWRLGLTESANKQMVISLDHQYTNDGFSLDSLKGIDRSRADILLRAAKQAECNAYIGLLEKYEMFSAFDEDEPNDLIEDYLSIDHLINAMGDPLSIKISHVSEEEVFSHADFEQDEEEAIEQDYEGYMGNYGNTLSRWYRHAAVILWPPEHQLEILARNGTSGAIAYLKDLQANKDPRFSKDLRTLLTMVLKQQCTARDENFWLLTLVLGEKDPEIAKIYCHYFLFSQHSLPSTRNIKFIIDLCGWDYLEKSLDMEDSATRTQFLTLLNKIKAALVWDENPALERLFYQAFTSCNNDKSWRPDASKNFALILPLCLALSSKECVAHLTAFMKKHSKRLSAETFILPYLEKHYRSDMNADQVLIYAPVIHLLENEFSGYQQTIKQKPEDSLVESIPSMDCHCADCQAVLAFMQSNKDEIDLGRLKAQCEHLSSQLQLHQVQVNHMINKRRRPWRFIMRKHGADQREKIATYQKAKAYMERLEKLL